GVHRSGEIADSVTVRREAEFHLSRDFIAFGDRHLSHVVSEATELRALPIVPGPRGAHPCANSLMNFRVGPMADDNLAGKTHARVDETRLSVAAGPLVKIHEIHVDRVPREFAIELG